ncbi:hypothetical protein AB0N05_13840 [Nocardia sp. NPDC051030]|uniref:hypothetical protein n=1 Tax=Nocardia sp. NPDC051030 TaxID=3155162 RepID=UPI0034255CB5
MTGLLDRYLRNDWFGPEGFAACILGILCIALPFIGWVPNDAWWFAFAPGLAGLALIPFEGTSRRIGIGLIAAFLAFVLALVAFLIGLGIGHLF